MKILVSGGTGFIGSALTSHLFQKGHSVSILTRSVGRKPGSEIQWNPVHGQIDEKSLEGFDAVVHLAGENIAAGRWTNGQKERIRESRVKGTRLLGQALSRRSRPPKVFLTASAIGYYGDRGSDVLTEESSNGKDFLAQVCLEWEEAARQACQRGIRVVHSRMGIVLGPNGGALSKMLLPFKLGIGGRLGSGRQYMSWVALEDVARAILFALENAALEGPFNMTAPEPVTNIEFTKTLARVLHRPAILPAPVVGLRLILGEMADALLLSSARVRPQKLLNAGYIFRHPSLEETLKIATSR